jgi:hypothetical protein
MNSGLQAASNIPGMMNTAFRGMDRDSANAFGSLRSTANQAGALRGMMDNTFSEIDGDYSNSRAGINSAMDQGYGAIGSAQNAITSSPIARNLMQTGQAGRDQLAGAMSSNDALLSNWVNAGLGSVRGTLNDSYGQLNRGMNQFYGNVPRDGARLLGNALASGSRQVGAIGSQLNNAFGSFNRDNRAGLRDANNQLAGIMDRTGVMSPEQQQQMRFRMDDAQSARNQQRGGNFRPISVRPNR